MPTLTPDAVLRAAADLLDTHPEMWGRDEWFRKDTGCRCSGGLIAYVIAPEDPDGDPYGVGDHSKHPDRLLAEAAVALFEAHVLPELEDRFDPEGIAAAGEPLIGLWNDRLARDAAHVAATMRAAANQARAAHLDANYTERGATARSWICRHCGADVDSAVLGAHAYAHTAAVSG